jgi:hypothetical protein
VFVFKPEALHDGNGGGWSRPERRIHSAVLHCTPIAGRSWTVLLKTNLYRNSGHSATLKATSEAALVNSQTS